VFDAPLGTHCFNLIGMVEALLSDGLSYLFSPATTSPFLFIIDQFPAS
jgi:hypothetical protein